MRVLVITRAPWRNDNNTGNTMTNFFSELRNVKFYNLYFRDQLPMNNVAVKSFSISEGQLLKNLLKKTPVGREVCKEEAVTVNTEEMLYKRAKKFGNVFLMWMRDILWSMGRWKSHNFKQFLNEIKPDVVFMPVFNCFYPHKILKFVKEQTDARVILFHADDNYTLKQFSLSPVYWLYRFNLRKWVRNSVRISDVNYAISNIQKEEYEKAFQKPFKLLTKALDFSFAPAYKDEYNKPLQLIFTGNITTNRWKSLAHIANALERINSDGVKAQLRIYTGNDLTEKMDKALNKDESSFVMGSVSADKVAEIQRNADMLVHVESLDFKNKLIVRQSFSTKIVDYLATARPILAFGPKDVASINHLIQNECAIVADNEEELFEKLSDVIFDCDKLSELSQKAYECGKKHHNKADIDKMLSDDIRKVVATA